MEGDYGRKLQKRKAREKLKGNGKGEETGKGNNSNLLLLIDSGVRGRAPVEKNFHVFYSFTNHLWLIDYLIFYNSVIQHSWVDLTSSGGETSPPGPTWRQFVSIPPLCKALQCAWPQGVCGPVISHLVCILVLDVDPLVLDFRVKYYPSDPEKLREELTRCFLFQVCDLTVLTLAFFAVYQLIFMSTEINQF